MLVSSAPISYDDFQATVLACIGQDTDGYGTSVFDWKKGDPRTRELWISVEGGFKAYSYQTDRYELMEMSEDENGVFYEVPDASDALCHLIE